MTTMATIYNYYRIYDPTVGRYLQSDALGVQDGPSTYAYVRNLPLSLTDPFGLATFINFPPDKEADMKAAIDEAKKKLRDCKDQPECFEHDGKEKIIKNLDGARYVYKPDLADCGEALRFPPWLGHIGIGPGAFDWARCCDLSSTLAHEANHLGRLRGGSENASRELERKCFNCPRPQR